MKPGDPASLYLLDWRNTISIEQLALGGVGQAPRPEPGPRLLDGRDKRVLGRGAHMSVEEFDVKIHARGYARGMRDGPPFCIPHERKAAGKHTPVGERLQK